MLKTYYHATPYKNMYSIFEKGIQKNFGLIYFSDDRDTAAKWICFTNLHEKKIAVFPFQLDENEVQISYDHTSKMTEVLGVNHEGAGLITTKNISAENIRHNMNKIYTYENPFYIGDDK